MASYRRTKLIVIGISLLNVIVAGITAYFDIRQYYKLAQNKEYDTIKFEEIHVTFVT